MSYIFNYIDFYNYYINPSNVITDTNDCVRLYYFTDSDKIKKVRVVSQGLLKTGGKGGKVVNIFILFFDKKKVEAELQSRNIFKKKHTKAGDFRLKWVYYGMKKRPPKPIIDSDGFNNEIKVDF